MQTLKLEYLTKICGGAAVGKMPFTTAQLTAIKNQVLLDKNTNHLSLTQTLAQIEAEKTPYNFNALYLKFTTTFVAKVTYDYNHFV